MEAHFWYEGNCIEVYQALDYIPRQGDMVVFEPETINSGTYRVADICWVRRDSGGWEDLYVKILLKDEEVQNKSVEKP